MNRRMAILGGLIGVFTLVIITALRMRSGGKTGSVLRLESG